jgi:hypothetical protein
VVGREEDERPEVVVEERFLRKHLTPTSCSTLDRRRVVATAKRLPRGAPRTALSLRPAQVLSGEGLGGLLERVHTQARTAQVHRRSRYVTTAVVRTVVDVSRLDAPVATPPLQDVRPSWSPCGPRWTAVVGRSRQTLLDLRKRVGCLGTWLEMLRTLCGQRHPKDRSRSARWRAEAHPR